MLANDEQGQQSVSSGHKSAAQHDPGSDQFLPIQSSVDHYGSSNNEFEHLRNGITHSGTTALSLNQSYSYGLSSSALMPNMIKENIWDKKYVKIAQLYQIQNRGEVKHSVNISNQGPLTLVKVQRKQAQW